MSDVPIIVPEGKKYTDLTMGELDSASSRLNADVLQCIAGDESSKRYGALVEVAIIWAKRSGATETREVLLKRFRDYEPSDMFHALRNDQGDAAEPPDPTESNGEWNGSSSPASSAD